MAAFALKLTVALLVVSMIPMLTVRADEGEGDYCNSCTRLVDDFSEELNGTAAQDLFERICIDLLGNDQDSVEYCQEENEYFFGTIRWLLQYGFDSNDTCVLLGACNISPPEQKARFAKLRQNHPLFKAQFQKLVAKSLMKTKSVKALKAVRGSKPVQKH